MSSAAVDRRVSRASNEAEAQRKERARRRDERDNIMFEKMSVLSQQLEGNARDMLVQEIMDMRDKLSSGNDEDKEQASIEMMSRAFSKCPRKFLH